jgi:hypothetical protein
MRVALLWLWLLPLLGLEPIAGAASAPARLPAPAEIPLPGATGAVSLDYLAVERTAGRVWIPAGNTASVDVLDVATRKISRIAGFATAERDVHGTARTLGPSSVTVGNGVVYVGNRASAEVCAVDPQKRIRIGCVTLPVAPDGLQFVAATKEVWVTTPRDRSITIVDASVPAQPKVKARVALAGEPEGYAVDDARGLFFTNLEDQDRTLAIDVRSRRVKATWMPGCGADGPRGLAFDGEGQVLIVACTDHLASLDAGHGGALVSRIDTGVGVDNIDFLPSQRRVYAAAGRAARLTIAAVDPTGRLTPVATAATTNGARVVVVAGDGTAFVADPARGRILVYPPAR